jgi:hypothetical protein
LMGVPVDISVVSGSNQVAQTSTPFALPLIALVRDAAGVPQAGIVVTITKPGSGASCTIVGTATSDANGHAQAPATANATSGTYLVTYSYTGATSAAFVLKNSVPVATTQGPSAPGGANYSASNGGTRIWTNASGIIGTVGEANCTKLTAGDVPTILYGRNFGFSLESTDVITGYTLTLNGRAYVTPGDAAANIRLSADVLTWVGNKTITLNSATLIPYTVGSISDLWGTSFTPAQVSTSNFSVGFFASSSIANSFGTQTWRLTVHYTTLGGVPLSQTSSPLVFCEA